MGWCYNLSRRSGRGWFSHWKIWTEGCEKHWREWWEIPPTAWRVYLQSKVFGMLEYQRGVKIFFAKRRSRIRPSILRPAPPEWTWCCERTDYTVSGVFYDHTSHKVCLLCAAGKRLHYSFWSILGKRAVMQTFEHHILEKSPRTDEQKGQSEGSPVRI